MPLMQEDNIRVLGPSYFLGSVDFGASLQNTGLINFYNTSSLFNTSFQAGNATAAITYTFPTAGPASNSYGLISTTTGTMSWANVAISGTSVTFSHVTVTDTSNPVQIGSLTDSSHITGLVIGTVFSSGASNAHAVTDISTFTGNNGVSFASFDSSSSTIGTSNYGHIIAFQANSFHASSGTLTNAYGFSTDFTNNGGATTNRYGYLVSDATGSGAVTNQYGLYISSLTKGGTLNYAIFTAGTTVSQFGGNVTITNSNPALNVTNTGTGVADILFRTNSAAQISALGIEGTPGGNIFTGSTAYAMVMGTAGSFKTQFFTNDTKRLEISELGSIVPGTGALATNATDGFLYIPTCAGTPTGTPTTFAGRVAMIYDTSNNKLYIYNGAWKGGTAPGAWS